MKKISLILVMALTLTMLFSCSKSGKEQTTNNQTPEVQNTLDFSIAGNELENYVIVYAESPYSVRDAKNFTTEHEFFKLIAKDIADKIDARTGVTLEIKKDKNQVVLRC